METAALLTSRAKTYAPPPGTDVRDALPRLLSAVAPLDARITLFALPVPRRAQTRLSSSVAAQPLIETARETRHSHGTPFWDALLLAALEHGPQIPAEVIASALYHQSTEVEGRSIELPVRSFTRERIDTEIHRLQEREMLVLRSRVTADNRHLPMLDLHVPCADKNAESVAAALLESLGEPGWLFNSGRSFHFYGTRLISDTAMIRYLARSQMLSPIVDGRWVSHQLQEGAAALRVSAGREKQHYPYFVRTIGR